MMTIRSARPSAASIARLVIAAAMLAGAVAAALPVQASGKPRAPLGKDPGGLAVALVAGGVDYTRGDVAARLARDGEGELIGWDAVSGDPRPFGPDNDLVSLFDQRIRVVPIAVDGAMPASLAEAVAFLGRTPVRVVVVAARGVSQESWRRFGRAAGEARNLLILIAAEDQMPDEIRRLDTAVTVAAWASSSAPPQAAGADIVLAPATALREAPGNGEAGPRSPVEAAIGLANLLVCEPAIVQQARSAQEARARILSRARPVGGSAARVLETCQDPVRGR